MLTLLKWMLIFAAIYIVLLPLGGYREYRPNIVRRDTLMPVILCLIFFYGRSSFYLLNHLVPKYKRKYLILIVIFSLVFTIADEPIFKHNACEKTGIGENSSIIRKNCSLK